MQDSNFVRDLANLEPGGVIAYTPLMRKLEEVNQLRRREIAGTYLPTALLCALQNDECLHDIQNVAETYGDLVPAILKADKRIKEDEALKTWVGFRTNAYDNFISGLGEKASSQVVLRRKELRGSRLRCLALTALSRDVVADFLTTMVKSYASVDENLDWWMPRGFLRPEEAQIGKSASFLSGEQCENITKWWLVNRRRANTPNWDIVSTCTLGERKGLILVEAKSHNNELKAEDACGAKNEHNIGQIRNAIGQANRELNSILSGWALSQDSHYQLSNRFTWAWKLANMRVPTILIYLGFLNAKEMVDVGQPFLSPEQWRKAVLDYAQGIVPANAWEKQLDINGTPFICLIRSANFSFTCSDGGAKTG